MRDELLNCRSLMQSMFRIGVFSNRWVVIGIAMMVFLQMLFTYVPLMNTLFSSAPISLDNWGRILMFGLASYLVIELEKWIRRKTLAAPERQSTTPMDGREL